MALLTMFKAVRMQRGSLLDLSLNAVGDQLVQICLRLLSMPRDSRADRKVALKLCDRLQEMYHSMIPHTLANEATEKLLTRLDGLSTNIRQHSQAPWKEELFQKLIAAVIHPAVTIIELSSAPEHIFPFGIKWNFLVPLVYNRLHALIKLKVLRLGRSPCERWPLSSINVSDTLEELTFIHNCNDFDLLAVAKKCNNLKRLNVRESKNVTDYSIDTFLRMENLEELIIVGTQISEKGINRLLEGFYYRECRGSKKMKHFGCSYITYNQLNALVDKLPNLMEIQLSHCGVFDLSPLRMLKNLRKLTFKSLKFGQIQDLLLEVGGQLVSLELRHIQSMDMRFIGEHCVALKCLHVHSYGVLQPPMEGFNREVLPGFQSVVCLQFDCDWRREWIDYILSQCTSVRKVDVTAHRSDTYLLLKHVLIRNPLKDLEQLCWSPTSPDGENIAKQLAEQCPHLSEVRGLCKNKINYRGVHLC